MSYMSDHFNLNYNSFFIQQYVYFFPSAMEFHVKIHYPEMIDRIWVLCDFRRRNMRGTSLRRPVTIQRLRQIAVTIKIKLLLCCCIVLAVVFFASRASDLMGWTCDDCSTAVRYSTPRFEFEPFDLIRSWILCASLIVRYVISLRELVTISGSLRVSFSLDEF